MKPPDFDDPPNKPGRIGEVWAILSVDQHGGEGVCGMPLGDTQIAMVTSERRILDGILIPAARFMVGRTSKRLKVVKFTTRTDIEEILP